MKKTGATIQIKRNKKDDSQREKMRESVDATHTNILMFGFLKITEGIIQEMCGISHPFNTQTTYI